MKPVKALKGYIEDILEFDLHILLTEEDDVVVARCLDFSISSHGIDKDEALESLSDSIKDYIEHALKSENRDEIIDPDNDELWVMYKELELQDEHLAMKEKANLLKVDKKKSVMYA